VHDERHQTPGGLGGVRDATDAKRKVCDMTLDEPVASGLSYTVTNVDGHSPSGLADFTGDVHLTVTKEGESTHLVGVVGGETHDGVRFYQKDPGLHDRDIRVWIITESGGSFWAEPLSAF
jgi:hypothetical protein